VFDLHVYARQAVHNPYLSPPGRMAKELTPTTDAHTKAKQPYRQPRAAGNDQAGGDRQ